jgi:hypothetical protein
MSQVDTQVMRLHLGHGDQQVAANRTLRQINRLQPGLRTRQAHLGHPVEVQIGEDLFEPWDGFEISRCLRHVQRVAAVTRPFPDRDFSSQLAEGFQCRIDQQGVRIDGAVRLELHQVGFQQHPFPADIQAMFGQHPAQFTVQILGVVRLAQHRNQPLGLRRRPGRAPSRAASQS